MTTPESKPGYNKGHKKFGGNFFLDLMKLTWDYPALADPNCPWWFRVKVWLKHHAFYISHVGWRYRPWKDSWRGGEQR